MRTLIVSLLLSLSLAASPAKAQDEDPLSLASLLINDGNYDRAVTVMEGIDPDQKGLDRARYFRLNGLLAYAQQDYEQAETNFRAAIKEVDEDETVDPTLYLYVARAELLSGDPEGAIRTLERAGAAVESLSSSYLIRARAARDIGDLPRAYTALAEGQNRFPAIKEFPRQQILLLVEMGLTREAGERATEYLKQSDASVDDVLTVAEALRNSNEIDRAATILEAARLRFPEEPKVLVRMAAVALDGKRPLTAARFLQIAAEFDQEYYKDAAELFRRAGYISTALYMNAQVLDAEEKVKQRFGLLLAAEDYERACALESRLSRLGLLREDDVAYGMAYAHFRTGDRQRAESLLKG
ncbi:MAG: hypothetical protein AAFV53_19625, partial [Myxococcota bacterium]